MRTTPIAGCFRFGKSPALTICGALALCSMASDANAHTLRQTDDGGMVRWHDERVDMTVEPAFEALGGARSALRRAFERWEQVGAPEVRLRAGAVDEVGYRKGEDNLSTVRTSAIAEELSPGSLAVTVVTFGPSGAIVDADIVVNLTAEHCVEVLAEGSPNAASEQGDGIAEATGCFDLQSVLTHEAGHLFGLGDERDIEPATMYYSQASGDLQKRSLHDDDVTGIQTLYEGDAETPTAGSCSAAPGAPWSPGVWIGIGLGLAALSVRRRRTHGRRVSVGLGVGAAVLVMATSVATARTADDDAPVASEDDRTWQAVDVVSNFEGGLVRSVATLQRAGATVEVAFYGGTADGYTQIVGHTPPIRIGDRLRLDP